MHRTGTLLAAAALTALLAGGCTLVDSQDIKTSGIWAYFGLDHHPDDTVVAWAEMRVGGSLGTVVTMSGGESIECNGTRLREYEEPITNYHWYRAEVSPSISGYDFEFLRTDEEVETHLESAAPPVILDVTPSLEARAGDSVTVTWDDSLPGDSIRVSITGACIQLQADSGLGDSGSYTSLPLVDADELNPRSCELTVTVTRVIDGQVNAAYDSGHTESRRIDSVSLDYRVD
ncbi:MAG TPA: hypothetical protein PK668_10835 [Myxococcota bacterium]|nr:hypothetical protein [Myxococcota bacterium]HRY93341.1 hypothetical protein [Myxococcota bacterium]HSA21056.1 hypothetical protein [Myxococcota bacterium]